MVRFDPSVPAAPRHWSIGPIDTAQVMMKFLTQTRGPLVPQTLNLRHLQENLEVIQSRNLSAPVLAKIAAKVANSRLNRIEL